MNLSPGCQKNVCSACDYQPSSLHCTLTLFTDTIFANTVHMSPFSHSLTHSGLCVCVCVFRARSTGCDHDREISKMDSFFICSQRRSHNVHDSMACAKWKSHLDYNYFKYSGKLLSCPHTNTMSFFMQAGRLNASSNIGSGKQKYNNEFWVTFCDEHGKLTIVWHFLDASMHCTKWCVFSLRMLNLFRSLIFE